MQEPARRGLDEGDIERIVQRYRLEMARYEAAARFVEQRLRRELREAAIPVLLSSRAKHPEDVRGKLRARREDERYVVDALLTNLNRTMTDLAGCRVIVYDPRQESVAADVVRTALPGRPPGRADEVLDKDSGYKATHILVVLDSADVDVSLQGAICEVQLTSIARHVFNELSHDIDYKHRGVTPGGAVQQHLRDVLNATQRLDTMVERLAGARAHELESSQRVIDTSEDLRFVLERLLNRPVRGEVGKLYRLLAAVLTPLTAHSIASIDVPGAIRGGEQAAAARPADERDDVICIALGLMSRHGETFRELASLWRGPSTALKRAILEASP
jgi:ppGpp synthetase/RelA/SpoT-type nucleotidyltranferase